MQNTYQTPNGKTLVATITGNTLSLYIPREPDIVSLKIQPKYRRELGFTMKRDSFDAFAAVVDKIDCASNVY